MKKVLLFYNFSYPLGGGDILPLMFASYLQNHCDLTMAVDSAAGLLRAMKAFEIPVDTKKITVEQLLPSSIDFRSHNFFWSFVRSRRLQRLAKRADICIYAGNVIDFGRPAHHFISILAGVDAAFSAHSGIVKPKHGLKRFLSEQIIRPIVGMRSKKSIFADSRERFYSNSNYVHKRLVEFYGKFNDTIFYPPSIYEPSTSDDNASSRDPLLVICLGRINPQKRVTDIIDIVERARKITGNDIRLVVAGPFGNGGYAMMIKQAIAERSWITSIDGVFGKEKDDLLRSGSFAVHARRDEEFGIAVTEYLKAGLITVVPNEGGSCEVVGQPELSYSTNEDAAKKLARLITDKAFAGQMQKHCLERAKIFSRNEYECRQRELLDKILADPSN